MSGGKVVPVPFGGPVGFSYEDLPHEAAIVARDAAANIRSAHEAFLPEVGRHLWRARDVMPHGTFTLWAEAELGLTDRTIRLYMQAARFLEGKPEIISVLPPTTLYALSAPTAAKEVVESVVAAAEAGELLDAKIINTRLNAAKQEAREAKQEAQELKKAQRRNPNASRETLAVNKAKREGRWKAQREREGQEQARAKQEAEERMRPLADAILACPGDLAIRLSQVLLDYGQRLTLGALLDAGLREVRS